MDVAVSPTVQKWSYNIQDKRAHGRRNQEYELWPHDPTGTNLELARKMTTGVQLWTVIFAPPPIVIHLLKQATFKAFRGSMQLT